MYCKLTSSIIPGSAYCFLTSRCLRVDPTVAFVWHIYLYFILFHICSSTPTVRVRQIYKSSVNDVSTWWLLARETSGHINNNFQYLWRETSQIQCGTGTVITNAPPPSTQRPTKPTWAVASSSPSKINGHWLCAEVEVFRWGCVSG